MPGFGGLRHIHKHPVDSVYLRFEGRGLEENPRVGAVSIHVVDVGLDGLGKGPLRGLAEDNRLPGLHDLLDPVVEHGPLYTQIEVFVLLAGLLEKVLFSLGLDGAPAFVQVPGSRPGLQCRRVVGVLVIEIYFGHGHRVGMCTGAVEEKRTKIGVDRNVNLVYNTDMKTTRWSAGRNQMKVTIHLPAVDGVPIEQVAEFWRELLDDAEVAIPYEIAFQEDGSYTMAIDQEHESNVRFFVDNGNILDWHNSRPEVATPAADSNTDEMDGEHTYTTKSTGEDGEFLVYWYDHSDPIEEMRDEATGELPAIGWYYVEQNPLNHVMFGEHYGPFTTSTEAYAACLASGDKCAS